jgi:hypothetical protein
MYARIVARITFISVATLLRCLLRSKNMGEAAMPI